MLLKDSMKKERSRIGLLQMLREQEIRDLKNENVKRIASEYNTTENDYSENFNASGWIEVGVYTKIDVYNRDDGRQNIFNNKRVVSNLNRETDNEFNERQFNILKKLKQKRKQEDKKYE
jgi:hypothetical protein